ncbi:hypothetical protein LguiB_004575 [Lonicera macranthoides]
MPNWMVEFALWAPNLNVVEYHGSAKARASIRQFEWHANKKTSSYKFNVLLTTYKMVIADSTHLRGVPWEVLVVDEGYRLKNAKVEDILRWGTKELFTDKNCRNKDEAVGDVKHNQRKRPSGLRDIYGDKCTGGNNKIVWDKNAIIKLLDRSNRHSSDNTKGNLENDLPGSVKALDGRNIRMTKKELLVKGSAKRNLFTGMTMLYSIIFMPTSFPTKGSTSEFEEEKAEIPDTTSKNLQRAFSWNDEPTEEQTAIESFIVVTDDSTCAYNFEKKEDNLAGGTEENEWGKLLRAS